MMWVFLSVDKLPCPEARFYSQNFQRKFSDFPLENVEIKKWSGFLIDEFKIGEKTFYLFVFIWVAKLEGPLNLTVSRLREFWLRRICAVFYKAEKQVDG